MEALDVFPLWTSRLFARSVIVEHSTEEPEVVEQGVDSFCCGSSFGSFLAIGETLGAHALDVLWLDVFAVDLVSRFPAADIVRSELLAFVVAVEGVDPALLGCSVFGCWVAGLGTGGRLKEGIAAIFVRIAQYQTK